MAERGTEIEVYIKYFSVALLAMSMLLIINYAVINYVTGYAPLPYVYGFLALAFVIAYGIILTLMDEYRNAVVTLLIPVVWSTVEYLVNPLKTSVPTYYTWILITAVALGVLAELEKRIGSEEEIERRLSVIFTIIFYLSALIIVLLSYRTGSDYGPISMLLLMFASIVGLALTLTRENVGLMLSLLVFLAFIIFLAFPKHVDVSDACLRSSYLAVAVSFVKAWFSIAS